MQSYLVRRVAAGAHHRLSVYAGPDSDHRALCGELVMLPVEADELFKALYLLQGSLRALAVTRAGEPEWAALRTWESDAFTVEFETIELVGW